MRAIAAVVILFSAIALVPGSDAKTDTCDSLDACLASLRTLAKAQGPHDGMGKEEDALLERIRSFKGATSALVRLLSDPDEKLAGLAAYGLRDTPQIDPIHLPEIIAGLDRELGWLPPALGRMASEEAAREAVSRYLISESAPHNQEAYAVELAGARAIPFIVEAARDADANHYLLGYALAEIGEAGNLAARNLFDIAGDESLPLRTSAGALLAISFLKGADIENDLLELRGARPELAGAIDHALVGIGSRMAGAIFAERLRAGRYDVTIFRDLAETGHAGHDAGPVLVELLQSEDWDVRLLAARALGYIGYEPAVPALAAMLEQREDVRLNWVAAESLGRISDVSAASALNRTAGSHWHPAVRQAASTAAERIREGTAYESEFHERNFAFDFFSYQHALRSGSSCRKWDVPAMREPENAKLYQDRDKKRLESLAFNTEIISYGAREDPDSRSEESRIITITPDNIVEHRRPQRQVPHIALRVPDGWLVGSNRGEWGGELAFVGDSGSEAIIAHVNVEDIYALGDRTLAITGLAHLTGNSGMVLAVERDAEGKWSARPWRSLPGAPTGSWSATGDRLLIQIGPDGLLLSPDGGMQMAECRGRG